LKFINNGNLPITSVDYEKPLSVHFGETANILSAEISKTDPENLGVTISANINSFVLSPTLLNPKDSISIKLLLNNYTGVFSIDTRIIGVSNVMPLDESTKTIKLLICLGLLFVTLGAIALSMATDNKGQFQHDWKFIFALVPYLGGAMLIAIGMLMGYRKRFYRLIHSFMEGEFKR